MRIERISKLKKNGKSFFKNRIKILNQRPENRFFHSFSAAPDDWRYNSPKKIVFKFFQVCSKFIAFKEIIMSKFFTTFLFWGLMISIGNCKVPLDYNDFLSDFKIKFQVHLIIDVEEIKPKYKNNEYLDFAFLPDVSSGTVYWVKLNKSPEIPGELVENIRCFGNKNQGLIAIFFSQVGTNQINSLIKNFPDKEIALVFNRKIIQKMKINEINPNTTLGLIVSIKRDFKKYSHLFFPVSIIEKVFIKAVEME